MNIELYRSFWTQKITDTLSIYVSGWAQYQNEIVRENRFLELIENINFNDNTVFQQFMLDLNGNFSIIITTSSKTIFAADKMRTIPLLYFKEENNFVITDDIIKYRKEKNKNFVLNENTCEQFLLTSYVFGPYTIFNDVYSIQSGEFIEIDNHKQTFTTKQYFRWEPKMNNDLSRNLKVEAEKQDLIFKSVFLRMINSVPDINNWIVPLSGGYDSRVIINYLYELGVKNVICYSFGVKNNIESTISQEIAEKLGYRWYFIDNPLEWIIKIQQTNDLKDYLDYAFNGTSTSSIGDFVTVYALKELGIIKKGDVFVPGHALDFLAGNHFDVAMTSCSSVTAVLQIIKKHFSGFAYHTKSRTQVNNLAKSIIANYNLSPQQIAESFNWQERQTKFIAHSVKCYEYFGFDYRLPKWDNELIDYWKEIGFDNKLNRKLFKDIFKNYLMIDELKSIPFSNDLIKEKPSYKSMLINSTPLILKKIIRSLGYVKKLDNSLDLESKLLVSNSSACFNDFINDDSIPFSTKKYLKAYNGKQSITTLTTLDIISLLNIKNTTL